MIEVKRLFAILWMLCWFAAVSPAAQQIELEDQVRAIAADLRCPVCQNLSVADSPSELAQQMRSIIEQQLKEGKSPEQVRAYFVSKYGEWILLAPKPRGFNLLLWVLPYFALVGGIWLIYLLDYNMSVAVGVGFIALAGLAAETGVIMLVYINSAYEERLRTGRMQTLADLYEAVIEATVARVRPIMMTVAAIIAGLLPIMLGDGTGSDVMRRIAALMVGGMISATLLTLVMIPALFLLWRRHGLPHSTGSAAAVEE